MMHSFNVSAGLNWHRSHRFENAWKHSIARIALKLQLPTGREASLGDGSSRYKRHCP
jgi:hypothetical protein